MARRLLGQGAGYLSAAPSPRLPRAASNRFIEESCRAGYSVTGGVADGTWGVIPEDTYDVSDAVSLWHGKMLVTSHALS
jgi:hypothetical protein